MRAAPSKLGLIVLNLMEIKYFRARIAITEKSR
jgi:hypothetical protein